MPINHEIDATGQSLGRIASRIAVLLRGKDQPSFTSNIAGTAKVVVKNLDKLVFKGTKAQSTKYHRHSGYPGGLYTRTLAEEWARSPENVLRMAVRGMLPENRTRDKVLQNLIIQK